MVGISKRNRVNGLFRFWLLVFGSWVLMGTLPASQVEILNRSNFHEEIANPQLTSPAAVQEKLEHYENVLAEMSQAPATPASEQMVRLLRRFLEFAKSSQDRDMVFLEEELAIQVPRSMNAVVRQQTIERIREGYTAMRTTWEDHIKLDLPPGLIFVKLYEGRDQMLKDYNLGPETAGVAFPCRYMAVALPYEERALWSRVKQYLIGEEFQQTVEHEFVHNFCFMVLGGQRAGTLPRWFMEGLALHLSNARHVRTAVEGPGGVTIRDFDSSDEYKDFKRLFRFVEERYGRARLYEFARVALRAGSLDRALPQVLNLSNETAFVGAAVGWRRDTERFQWRLLFGVGILVCVAFVACQGHLRQMLIFSIIWLAFVYAARSPYYVYTMLWWVPVLLFPPLVVSMIRYISRLRLKPNDRVIASVGGRDHRSCGAKINT